MRKIGLDTRHLEHPAPLEMAMKVLQSLDEETYLYMLHRKRPLPLIDLANTHQFQVHTYEDKSKIWHILISKNKDVSLRGYLDV